VVLAGRLHDGAAGAKATRDASGVVLAQDPASCQAPEMPTAALRAGVVHRPAILRARASDPEPRRGIGHARGTRIRDLCRLIGADSAAVVARLRVGGTKLALGTRATQYRRA
jgi:hypothetical protein